MSGCNPGSRTQSLEECRKQCEKEFNESMKLASLMASVMGGNSPYVRDYVERARKLYKLCIELCERMYTG